MGTGRGLRAVTVVALAASLVSTPVASAATAFQNYVALGDSYTAGPLIPDQRNDPADCLRSGTNYASVLAGKLVTRSLDDRSCSDADSTHMTRPQPLPSGARPPQLDALNPRTDLVTLGIGGNDYNLLNRIFDICPALRDTDPTGTPCQRYFTSGGTDTLKLTTTQIKANVAAVLQEIKTRAPQAKVSVIGYPRIVPPAGYCPAQLPFADGDYGWVDSIEEALNEVIGAAAEEAGVSFVDLRGYSLGHDACASGGAAWLNGQTVRPDAAPYHPLAEGMRAIAGVIFDRLLKG